MTQTESNAVNIPCVNHPVFILLTLMSKKKVNIMFTKFYSEYATKSGVMTITNSRESEKINHFFAAKKTHSGFLSIEETTKDLRGLSGAFREQQTIFHSFELRLFSSILLWKWSCHVRLHSVIKSHHRQHKRKHCQRAVIITSVMFTWAVCCLLVM